MQEQGTISIHTENIFPIIKKFLYSDNEIFLRELVSNAVDAVQKAKRLAILGQFQGELGEPLVQVKVDAEAKTITISDNGIGMTAEEVKKYINQVAFSGATEFMERFKEAKDAQEIIGRFGLGFYSAFMVADKVDIQTKSYQQDAQPVHWTCDGTTTFSMEEGARTERGTDVILHINDESAEFLENYRIQNILNKYAQFLPVPVQFGMRSEEVEDGVDEEGKTKWKSIDVPNIINNTEPIWVKSPSDLKDEDYLKFYRELYPFAEDPLFWIHLNVDYPFNLTGILYFPKLKNNVEIQKNKIKLFSRQVFITDEVKDIVPEFLMLLHGVIDSPDIPLNVSRSFLQADSNVKKINTYITKKVADKLNELFVNDRSNYEAKWNDLGVFVKYGAITDNKFWEKAKSFTLLSNTDKQFYTIDSYQEHIKERQTNKDGQLVWLYSVDEQHQYTYIQQAKDKGYDVLVLNGPLDNHFVSHLERSLDKTLVRRVDADVLDKLIDKGVSQTSSLSSEQEVTVKSAFTSTITNEHYEWEMTPLSEQDAPLTITMDEWMRRMKEMAAMGADMGMYGTLPDRYKITINSNHPMMQKLLSASEEEKKVLAQNAFDLALLANGMLKGKALADFVNRSYKQL